MKFFLFFIVLGFRFGNRKDREILHSKRFIYCSIGVFGFTLIILFLGNYDNVITRPII